MTLLIKDSEWSLIDGERCRVINFSPLASVVKGRVLAPGKSDPYALVTMECRKAPEIIKGYIAHKKDFMHLWEAFKERTIKENEEVIVFWSKKHYKWWARIFSGFMPRLWVMVCTKGAYELESDPSYKPELKGEARWNAAKPIMDWKPEVMK